MMLENNTRQREERLVLGDELVGQLGDVDGVFLHAGQELQHLMLHLGGLDLAFDTFLQVRDALQQVAGGDDGQRVSAPEGDFLIAQVGDNQGIVRHG
jgi:hypothetical protein